eukprot:m.202242 g.202242  ORF g.202242 m.202242 type:complete len:417 (+) comp15750_c0_seq16:177-1427(+)
MPVSKERWSAKVSGPGKVIMFGEHSVVYGKLAIAASVDLRATMHVEQTNLPDTIELCLPDLQMERSWKMQSLIKLIEKRVMLSTYVIVYHDSIDVLSTGNASSVTSLDDDGQEEIAKLSLNPEVEGDENSTGTDPKYLAAFSFLRLFCSLITDRQTVPGLKFTLTSELPLGAGLGSSAAFGVGLAACMLYVFGHIPEPGEDGLWDEATIDNINDWAFVAEKAVHGTPSGIDNTISAFGGALKFLKGTTPIHIKIPKLRILLVNTKVPRSTKHYVAQVRAKVDKNPGPMKHVLEAMHSICEDACKIFEELLTAQSMGETTKEKELFSKLEELTELNQHLLCGLGVGHPALDKVWQAARAHGFFAKLTGAGGGGCAFILIPSDAKEENVVLVKESMVKEGFSVFETAVGSPGVTLSRS